MAITISASDQAVSGAPLAPRLSTPQVWGIVLIAPYLLVFAAFVRLSGGLRLLAGAGAVELCRAL